MTDDIDPEPGDSWPPVPTAEAPRFEAPLDRTPEPPRFETPEWKAGNGSVACAFVGIVSPLIGAFVAPGHRIGWVLAPVAWVVGILFGIKGRRVADGRIGVIACGLLLVLFALLLPQLGL